MSRHENTLSAGQQANFHAAVIKALPRNIDPMVARWWDKHGKKLAEILRENLVCPSELNPVVNVDRSMRPSYPKWVKKVKNPELERIGPSQYDIRKDVFAWLHPKQRKSHVGSGWRVYDYLEKKGMLASCLGLADLCALHLMEHTVFPKRFVDKRLFAWRSVVERRGDGGCFVPSLYRGGIFDDNKLEWLLLAADYRSNYHALRFHG